MLQLGGKNTLFFSLKQMIHKKTLPKEFIILNNNSFGKVTKKVIFESYFTKSTISFTICNSSLVGIIRIFTRLSAACISTGLVG